MEGCVCRDRSNRAAPYHFSGLFEFHPAETRAKSENRPGSFSTDPRQALGESRKVTRLYQPPSFLSTALYPLCRCRPPRAQALAERQSCVAPERRKMPLRRGSCAGWTPASGCSWTEQLGAPERRASMPSATSLYPRRCCPPLGCSESSTRRGHQGFLFCKCQALLPLTRASRRGGLSRTCTIHLPRCVSQVRGKQANVPNASLSKRKGGDQYE